MPTEPTEDEIAAALLHGVGVTRAGLRRDAAMARAAMADMTKAELIEIVMVSAFTWNADALRTLEPERAAAILDGWTDRALSGPGWADYGED